MTMFKVALVIFIAVECSGAPQFGLEHFPLRAHPAVEKNAQQEDRLPSHLRNPHYQDPRIARALAYSSWLGPGEKPVYSRDSEKIPRREIYNVLVHAGFIPRQRRFQNY